MRDICRELPAAFLSCEAIRDIQNEKNRSGHDLFLHYRACKDTIVPVVVPNGQLPVLSAKGFLYDIIQVCIPADRKQIVTECLTGVHLKDSSSAMIHRKDGSILMLNYRNSYFPLEMFSASQLLPSMIIYLQVQCMYELYIALPALW